MFYKTPLILKLCFPGLVWEMPASEKLVYLTFDDGPDPEITSYVMDELEKRGFRATFFCIGENVRKFPEAFEETLSRGHKVGNHTMRHLNGWKSSTEHYVAEVAECGELVQSRLFRPPYGKIRFGQQNALEHKYKIIMWSLLSWDFKVNFNAKRSLRKLIRHTKPGYIVVFHDSKKSLKNLKAILPAYLDFLKSAGYQSALFT